MSEQDPNVMDEFKNTLKTSRAMKSPEDFVDNETGKVLCEIIGEQVDTALDRLSLSRKIFRRTRLEGLDRDQWRCGHGMVKPAINELGLIHITSSATVDLNEFWSYKTETVDRLDALYTYLVEYALKWDDRPVHELVNLFHNVYPTACNPTTEIERLFSDIRRSTTDSVAILNANAVTSVFSNSYIFSGDWFDFHGKSAECVLTGEFAVIKHLGKQTKLFTNMFRPNSANTFPVDFLHVTGDVGYISKYPVSVTTEIEDSVPLVRISHSLRYELYPSVDTMKIHTIK